MSYLAPNWTSGPSGKDPYRRWVHAVLDGLAYFTNGWDRAWRWDPSAPSSFYDIGADAPTTFAVADAAGGSTFPAGTVLRYKLVFRNSNIAKDTAPQRSVLASGDTVTYVEHTMSGTKDAFITWTDPGGEFNKARIFRALQSSNTFHFVADVTASTASYTDATTDVTLRSRDAIAERYRGTKPPIAAGIASHLNRLWLWRENSSNLEYSQLVDPVSGELLQEDFPDENVLPVGPEASCGFIRAFWSRDGSAFVFKDTGVWEVAGEDPYTFQMRQAVSDRGCLNQSCFIEHEGVVFVLDPKGLWKWSPGGEPVVCAARPKRPDPLRTLWKRMYLGVVKRFHMVQNTERHEILLYLCLDFEPTPNVRVRYDVQQDRFTSIDTMVWGSAAGELQDANAAEHPIRIDDRAVVWEDEQSDSEGAFDGTRTATVTSVSGFNLVASAATYDSDVVGGAPGSPFRRYTSAGVLIEENRVESAAGNDLTPYYYSTTAGAAGQLLRIGVIPASFALMNITNETQREKAYPKIVVEHDQESSGSTLVVSTSANDAAFVVKQTLDLSADVRSVAEIDNFAWRMQPRFSQEGPGQDFAVSAVYVYARLLGDRR